MLTANQFSYIFVLCTGRCGSLTFSRACEQFTNYSSGHETLSREFGYKRLDYPPNHIEVDNRLAWFLGRLNKRFGKDAFYVHLYRDADKVAKSYDKRWSSLVSLVSAFNHGLMMQKAPSAHAAPDLIETVTENILYFLSDKPHQIAINIDDPEPGFREFAERIGATGDIDAAIRVFAEIHNPSDGKKTGQVVSTEPERRTALMDLDAKLAKMIATQKKQLATQKRFREIAVDELQHKLKRVRRREKLAWIAALPTVLLLSPILIPFFGIKWALKRYAKANREPQVSIPRVMDGALAEGSTSPSTLHTVLEEPTTVLQKAVTNPAHKTYPDAIRYAEAQIEEPLRGTVEVLRANQALLEKDERAWLKHVNAYLHSIKSDPITLSAVGETLFDRLAADVAVGSVEGPLISVLMPAWNCEETIRKSALSILNQSWKNLELIIIDDFSEDNTWVEMLALAAQDDRVKLLRNKVNVGPYASKNLGLDIASGVWITGHDADDWAHPKRFENHMNAVLARPSPPRASYTYMVRMQRSGWFGRLSKISNYSFDGIARLSSVSTLYEADFLREQLGYWDSVRFGADSEMIARAKILLGQEFEEYHQIGMLCLDEATSLTNRPDTGLGGRQDTANHPRIQYHKSWEKWQRSAEEALQNGAAEKPLYLPLVQMDRVFDAPERMRVPSVDVQRNASHLAVEPQQFEPVTVICVSKRPHLLPQIQQNILEQRHPNLEVIFVAHGTEFDLDAVNDAFKDHPNFRMLVQNAPDSVLADGLNLALDHAQHDLAVKFDDDDYYEPDFLLNQARTFELYEGTSLAPDLALVGKAAFFTYIEQFDSLGLRFSKSNSNKVVNKVHGGTMLWRRSQINDLRFEKVRQGTDTRFQAAIRDMGKPIMAGDPYDFVHMRYFDSNAHTWKISDEDYSQAVFPLATGLRRDIAISAYPGTDRILMPASERVLPPAIASASHGTDDDAPGAPVPVKAEPAAGDKVSNYAANYWANRSDMLYYSAIDKVIRTVGYDASSILDVGSGNCPYLDWWTWIPKKVSIDIRSPYASNQVEAVVGNIMDYHIDQKFDICTCFQVLEHVPDAAAFARRLFDLGTVVIISVPYKWPAGRTTGHVHDPVDEEKLKSWVGRRPNQYMVIAEPFGSVKHERLIAIYDPNPKRRFNSKSLRHLRNVGAVRETDDELV